jgi:hypothetical protein
MMSHVNIVRHANTHNNLLHQLEDLCIRVKAEKLVSEQKSSYICFAVLVFHRSAASLPAFASKCSKTLIAPFFWRNYEDNSIYMVRTPNF